MRKLLLFVLICISANFLHAQTNGDMRYDSVRLFKAGGYTEFVLRNRTKDSLGFLFNKGNGVTEFRRAKQLNDSTLVFGVDTFHVRGGGSTGSDSADVAGYGMIISKVGNVRTHKVDSGLIATRARVKHVIDSLTTVQTTLLAAKQGTLTLTTTGSSGPSTLISNTLNIPQYSGGGSVSVRDSLSYINAAKFNMGPLVTDNGAALRFLISLGFKSIYIPRGYYPWTTTVNIPDSVKIFGDRGGTVIRLNANVKAFYGSNTTGGYKSEITGLSFVGTWGSGGNSSQEGIVLDSLTGCSIHDNTFTLIAGNAIRITNSAYSPGTNEFTYGNVIYNNYGEANQCGLNLDVRGEFTTFSGNTFVGGSYGCKIKSGNVVGAHNNFSTNGQGIYMETGSNDGHGVLTGNIAAHCGTNGFYANGILNGMELDGNDFNGSNVTIIDCFDMVFNGGQISTNRTITITNCTRTFFFDQIYLGGPTSAPTWSYTGEKPTVITRLNGINTIAIYDVESTSFFIMRNVNGMFEFVAQGSGAFFKFTGLPIYTWRGNQDATRDFCSGPSRFDYGGSDITDFFQVYKSNGTGSSFWFGNYHRSAQGYVSLYGDNDGKVGVWTDAPTHTFDVNGPSRFRDTVKAEGRISYNSNIHSTFTQYSLIDKAYLDSMLLLVGGGTTYVAGTDIRISGTNVSVKDTLANKKSYNADITITSEKNIPAVKNVREIIHDSIAANADVQYTRPLNTTNNTVTTIDSINAPTNTITEYEVVITALNGSDGAVYRYRIGVKNISDVNTIVGGSAIPLGESEDTGLVSASTSVTTSGNYVVFRVTGITSTSIDWKITYKAIAFQDIIL